MNGLRVSGTNSFTSDRAVGETSGTGHEHRVLPAREVDSMRLLTSLSASPQLIDLPSRPRRASAGPGHKGPASLPGRILLVSLCLPDGRGCLRALPAVPLASSPGLAASRDTGRAWRHSTEACRESGLPALWRMRNLAAVVEPCAADARRRKRCSEDSQKAAPVEIRARDCAVASARIPRSDSFPGFWLSSSSDRQ